MTRVIARIDAPPPAGQVGIDAPGITSQVIDVVMPWRQ
jgi:hypothetical protein